MFQYIQGHFLPKNHCVNTWRCAGQGHMGFGSYSSLQMLSFSPVEAGNKIICHLNFARKPWREELSQQPPETDTLMLTSEHRMLLLWFSLKQQETLLLWIVCPVYLEELQIAQPWGFIKSRKYSTGSCFTYHWVFLGTKVIQLFS